MIYFVFYPETVFYSFTFPTKGISKYPTDECVLVPMDVCLFTFFF